MAALSLLCPLVLDLMAEITNILTKKSKEKDVCQPDEVLLNSTERFVFFIGVALVPLTAFLPPTQNDWAYIYLCCTNAQLSLVGSAVFISLCRYDKEYWTVRLTNVSLSLFAFGNALSSFIDNRTERNLAKADVSDALSNIAYYSVLAAVVIFLYCSVMWLKVVVPMFIGSYWYETPIFDITQLLLPSPSGHPAGSILHSQDHKKLPILDSNSSTFDMN